MFYISYICRETEKLWKNGNEQKNMPLFIIILMSGNCY